jgi:hypothetical protein
MRKVQHSAVIVPEQASSFFLLRIKNPVVAQGWSVAELLEAVGMRA